MNGSGSTKTTATKYQQMAKRSCMTNPTPRIWLKSELILLKLYREKNFPSQDRKIYEIF